MNNKKNAIPVAALFAKFEHNDGLAHNAKGGSYNGPNHRFTQSRLWLGLLDFGALCKHYR